MTDLNEIAHAHLAQIGVPEAIARRVRLEQALGDRAVIAVGYQTADRFIETAVLNVPSVDDAFAILLDPERIAALLGSGVKAIPANIRPDVPEWIERASLSLAHDLRRARSLSNAGLQNQDRSERYTRGGGAAAAF